MAIEPVMKQGVASPGRLLVQFQYSHPAHMSDLYQPLQRLKVLALLHGELGR